MDKKLVRRKVAGSCQAPSSSIWELANVLLRERQHLKFFSSHQVWGGRADEYPFLCIIHYLCDDDVLGQTDNQLPWRWKCNLDWCSKHIWIIQAFELMLYPMLLKRIHEGMSLDEVNLLFFLQVILLLKIRTNAGESPGLWQQMEFSWESCRWCRWLDDFWKLRKWQVKWP